MYMKLRILSIALFSFVFILAACNDTATTTPAPAVKTKTDLLCFSNWKLTAAVINPGIDIGGGTLITDLRAQSDSCDLDNFTKFNADKTGTDDNGLTKCDPTDPQSTPFVWAFNLDETKITYDGDLYDIVTLNETTLIIKIIIDGEDLGATKGDKYTITTTFKH
jgi:hypothetical protein